MALRTNSMEVLLSVREHIRENLPELAPSGTGRTQALEPTSYDALQVLKQELGYEWARYGSHEAFKHWVQGLGFGDFMNAREIVSGWLRQTADEASAYPTERSEELYVGLLDREFFKMADKEASRLGYRIDVTPYVQRSGERQGKVLNKVDVYRDGALAASVDGLEPWQSGRLYDLLDRSIKETGDVPLGFRAAAKSPVRETMENALRAFADRALVYVRNAERNIDEWKRDAISEDTYYQRMGAIDRALKNDVNLSISLQDFADEAIDRYFEESGCQAAKSPRTETTRKEPLTMPVLRDENDATFTPGQIMSAKVDSERGLAYVTTDVGDIQALPIETYQMMANAVRVAERAGTCTAFSQLTVDGWKQKLDAAQSAIASATSAHDEQASMPRLRNEGSKCERASTQIASGGFNARETAAPATDAPEKADGAR